MGEPRDKALAGDPLMRGSSVAARRRVGAYRPWPRRRRFRTPRQKTAERPLGRRTQGRASRSSASSAFAAPLPGLHATPPSTRQRRGRVRPSRRSPGAPGRRFASPKAPRTSSRRSADLHNALVQIKGLPQEPVHKTFYDIGHILKDIQARRLYEAKGLRLLRGIPRARDRPWEDHGDEARPHRDHLPEGSGPGVRDGPALHRAERSRVRHGAGGQRDQEGSAIGKDPDAAGFGDRASASPARQVVRGARRPPHPTVRSRVSWSRGRAPRPRGSGSR